MTRPPFEVADIIRAHGNSFVDKNRSWLTWLHLRILFAIEHCRTAALGGHLDRCGQCGHEAISNHRLVSMADGNVTFRWKDYAHANKKRKMTVTADEFLRRFLLHVLPRGFVRIRHFGFLSARRRRESIAISRQLLAEAPRSRSPTPTTTPPPVTTWPCPCCGGTMIILEKLTAQQIRLRSAEWKDLLDSS